MQSEMRLLHVSELGVVTHSCGGFFDCDSGLTTNGKAGGCSTYHGQQNGHGRVLKHNAGEGQ